MWTLAFVSVPLLHINAVHIKVFASDIVMHTFRSHVTLYPEARTILNSTDTPCVYVDKNNWQHAHSKMPLQTKIKIFTEI